MYFQNMSYTYKHLAHKKLNQSKRMENERKVNLGRIWKAWKKQEEYFSVHVRMETVDGGDPRYFIIDIKTMDIVQ